MITPPGLVGAALLFWGWHTGLFPFAVALAIALEGARLVRWRWDLSARDQNRVADLSTLLFLALGVYLAVTAGMTRAALLTLSWLPLSLLPLMALSSWSSTGRISLTTLFWSRRQARVAVAAGAATTIDLGPIYAGICVLSASVANYRGVAFYAGACLIAAWAIWPARSVAHSRVAWAAAFALAATLGWLGHVGLNRLQGVVERVTSEMFSGAPEVDVDPYRSLTSIGSVGALKLAERIVLRVESTGELARPLLLREATYTTYRGRTWIAAPGEFAPLAASGDPPRFMLVERPGDRRIEVTGSLKRGRAVLALPGGAVRVHGLGEGTVRRTPLGAVRLDGASGLLRYGVDFAPETVFAAPPTEADLQLPREESVALLRAAAALGSAGREPREIVGIVDRHFRTGFRYTTYLSGGQAADTPLADFLERSRAGHCEYFATAATLLLRAAGVPARYATGYSVQEWSRFEQRWIVRARHAHAWTLVWLDGAWRELDTTPPEWVEGEGREAPAWEPIADFWSWLTFTGSRAVASETGSWLARRAWWLLAPLTAWLVWRLAPRRGGTRSRVAGAGPATVAAAPGSDSEFYAIERLLATRGLGRRPEEPVLSWLARIGDALPGVTALDPLVQLHCRYRFDPAGISGDERRALRDGIKAWLATATAPP